jgi:hypothetical protein
MASRNRYKLHKSDADSLAGGFVDIWFQDSLFLIITTSRVFLGRL